MNKQIRIAAVLALVLVGLVALSGGVHAAGPGDDDKGTEKTGPVGNVEGNVPITADAFGMDARQYASDYGVSLEEAKRRLTLQESVGALQAELLANESSTFGGLWIQHEPQFRIVARFTRDGATTTRPYVADGPLSGLVETRTAAATLDELRAAQDDATNIARAAGVAVESQIDVMENRVKLFVVDREELDSSLAAPDVELPSEVDVVTVDELSRKTTDLHAGLTLVPCTAGFAVTHSDGRRGITSAAHCEPNQTFNGTALSFVRALNGGKYDVQWYEAPGFTLRNLIKDGSGNRYVRGTQPLARQTVGTYVCKYGKKTRFGCGNIVATDFKPPATTRGCPISLCTYSATFIRVHKHRVTLSEPGDSGGPWFFGNTAYGIMTDAAKHKYPDGSFVWDGVYMAVDYFSGLGLSVLTR